MGTTELPSDPTEVDDRQYGNLYPVARAVLEPIFRTLWRVHVTGREHVPDTGPAIFCPNHTSVIDSFFLPLALPRKITFVGKAEYMDDWKTRHLFPAMGMIPIDRGRGSAAERALTTAARVLERGELFGIYPEGTRARDGRLHRGRTGAARLALRTGAPIIPVGIVGTREIQPPDAKLPSPFKAARVSFGRPVQPERYAGRADDRLVLRQMIDEVMFEIRAMTGQDYVDEYASSGRKPATGAAPGAPPDAPGATEENGTEPHGPAAQPEPEPVPVLVPSVLDVTETGPVGNRRSSAEVLARWSEAQGA